ncbi:MAG: hypothetical protein ACXAC8_11210, partial [Candidatus Hodarchaeales archaeon]
GYRLLHELEPDYKQKIVFSRYSGHSSSDTLKKYLSSVKGQKALVHVGGLTKTPFDEEAVRKLELFSSTDFHFPSLGSSIEL